MYRWIESGLPDLSISRSTSRLQWGIKVPGNEDQCIYVWLDALVNYLTVGGYPNDDYVWPADCHIVGKDILRFHAIYWPAFLMAANLEPPRHIHCHGHWLIHEEKMSKSKGNVVDPFDKMDKFTVDGLRYFLLRNGIAHADSQYYDERVVQCLNIELCNTFANLLSRCTGKAINPTQKFPSFCKDTFKLTADECDVKMLEHLSVLPETVSTFYEEMNFYKGIDAIMQQLRDTNEFVDRKQPWNLRKDPTKEVELETVIYITLETLRVVGILLQPIIPTVSSVLLNRLNVPDCNRMYEHALTRTNVSTNLGENHGHLFPRMK